MHPHSQLRPAQSGPSLVKGLLLPLALPPMEAAEAASQAFQATCIRVGNEVRAVESLAAGIARAEHLLQLDFPFMRTA